MTLDTDDIQAIADAVWQKQIDGYTAEQITMLMASVLLGKLSGAGTGTEVFKGLCEHKSRVTATVDNSGNRLAIVYDTTTCEPLWIDDLGNYLATDAGDNFLF